MNYPTAVHRLHREVAQRHKLPVRSYPIASAHNNDRATTAQFSDCASELAKAAYQKRSQIGSLGTTAVLTTSSFSTDCLYPSPDRIVFRPGQQLEILQGVISQ